MFALAKDEYFQQGVRRARGDRGLGASDGMRMDIAIPAVAPHPTLCLKKPFVLWYTVIRVVVDFRFFTHLYHTVYIFTNKNTLWGVRSV